MESSSALLRALSSSMIWSAWSLGMLETWIGTTLWPLAMILVLFLLIRSSDFVKFRRPLDLNCPSLFVTPLWIPRALLFSEWLKPTDVLPWLLCWKTLSLDLWPICEVTDLLKMSGFTPSLLKEFGYIGLEVVRCLHQSCLSATSFRMLSSFPPSTYQPKISSPFLRPVSYPFLLSDASSSNRRLESLSVPYLFHSLRSFGCDRLYLIYLFSLSTPTPFWTYALHLSAAKQSLAWYLSALSSQQ